MPYTFQVGDDITADRLNWDKLAWKTADTSRDTTTTRTADPHLTVSVAANARYLINGTLFYTATATADLSIAWSAPTGATGVWTAFCTGTGATTTDPVGYQVRTDARTDLTQGHTCAGLGSPNPVAVLLGGHVETSSTAGTLALVWAQAASGAIATTLMEGSWVRFTRVG